jgi:hypothetical protein
MTRYARRRRSPPEWILIDVFVIAIGFAAFAEAMARLAA